MSQEKKLYCYVDESGQDTYGKLFLVSVVITKSKRDELRTWLQELEKSSKKYKKKWNKSSHAQRENYITAILQNKLLRGNLYFSYYEETKTYVDLTILSIAKAIHTHTKQQYTATILVDGLKKTERLQFAAGLRKLNVKTRKVRGVKDESDELARLADALAGFVRNAIEENPTMKKIYTKAFKKKVIIEA